MRTITDNIVHRSPSDSKGLLTPGHYFEKYVLTIAAPLCSFYTSPIPLLRGESKPWSGSV